MGDVIADRLRQASELAGRSQRKIAETMGVSTQSVGKWLSGASRPELDKLVKLCNYLKAPVDFVLDPASGAITDESLLLAQRIKELVMQLGYAEAYRRLVIAPPESEPRSVVEGRHTVGTVSQAAAVGRVIDQGGRPNGNKKKPRPAR